MKRKEVGELAQKVATALSSKRMQRWLKVWSGGPSDHFADGPCGCLAIALWILDGQRGRILDFGGGHYAYRPYRSRRIIDGQGCHTLKQMTDEWGPLIDVLDTVPWLGHDDWSLTRALLETMIAR